MLIIAIVIGVISLMSFISYFSTFLSLIILITGLYYIHSIIQYIHYHLLNCSMHNLQDDINLRISEEILVLYLKFLSIGKAFIKSKIK